jgi:hypothetical protein
MIHWIQGFWCLGYTQGIQLYLQYFTGRFRGISTGDGEQVQGWGIVTAKRLMEPGMLGRDILKRAVLGFTTVSECVLRDQVASQAMTRPRTRRVLAK